MAQDIPLALAAVLLLACPATAQQRVEVIDGDTLRAGGRVVRLRGIDAPELHARCPEERTLAERATARLAQLAADGVHVFPEGRDRYGRTLATVRDRAGRDLGVVLLLEGLARPYTGRGQRQGWC
jgi:micrococcal nuclease